MIITAFDGSIFASVDDKIFKMKYLPRNQEYSSFVDFHLPEKEKSPIIADRAHPWHYDSLSKFMKNNQLRDIGLAFSEVANTQAVLY